MDNAIWLTTREFRSQAARHFHPGVTLPSLIEETMLIRLDCSAGASPKTTPVTIDSTRANSSTLPSTLLWIRIGRLLAGARSISSLDVQNETTIPVSSPQERKEKALGQQLPQQAALGLHPGTGGWLFRGAAAQRVPKAGWPRWHRRSGEPRQPSPSAP